MRAAKKDEADYIDESLAMKGTHTMSFHHTEDDEWLANDGKAWFILDRDDDEALIAALETFEDR